LTLDGYECRNADLEREIFYVRESFTINSVAAVLGQGWKSNLLQWNTRDSWKKVISFPVPWLFMHIHCVLVLCLHHHTWICQTSSQAADLNSHENLVLEAGDWLLTVQDFYQQTCDIRYLAVRKK